LGQESPVLFGDIRHFLEAQGLPAIDPLEHLGRPVRFEPKGVKKLLHFLRQKVLENRKASRRRDEFCPSPFQEGTLPLFFRR
jgi:hypothetical protein